MSFREMRNFTEMMRALGYPRLISMENFRSPNFALVAEILVWLVKRYDPNAEIPLDIETEDDRVMFIRTVAHSMATKAHIKLNTKKLYTADGYAVKELLKITQLLYGALRSSGENSASADENQDEISHFNFDMASKLADLKVTRKLASEITTRGANLYDMLANEQRLRELRSATLGKQLEISVIERGLKESIKGVEDEVRKTNQLIENVAADEANLEAKIEKKRMELERNQKRLLTLKSVRPAFMDEFERLEQELERIYELYLVKFRCLAALEQQLEELEKAEQEQIQEREHQIKRMVEKLRQDEMLRNDGGEEDEDEESLEDIHINPSREEKVKRPQPAGSGVRRDSRRRNFGSMNAERSHDSLESDSDLDLEGEDDDASDLSDDDVDLDLEVSSAKTQVNVTNSNVGKFLNDSDNDF